MKMTQLFRRSVSVWLYIAVVCWSSSLFECVESPPEEHRPRSTPISIPSEESHYQETEKSFSFPAQSESDAELLTDDDHSQTLQKAPEDELKAHAETFEAEKSDFEVELGASKVTSNPESSASYPETSASQDQVVQPASTNPEFGSSAVNPDDSSSAGLQEDVPNSGLSDGSGSEALHNDCEEEEENLYDTERPPLIVENTSNVHTTGTNIHADPPLSPPAAPADRLLDSNTSKMLTEPSGLSPPGATTDTESSGSKEPEDIPTFDEWKRKMMEVEKKKTLTTETFNNGGSNVAKKVQKHFNNYASVECGAKLLGANPEAKSTSAILKENMDLYMLNPCSTKIWFIIELCEPIQVRQLDIANFELFSSTPKDFLVSISDRYPTNKWLKLGTFHARDERTVQSFPLDEQLYAKYVKMFTKYIKVELLSHFGSEHFCPLSLIRVFGTSMVEEYEIADPSERADDQDDDLDNMGVSPGEPKSSENLIGSAKDAIMNMVNNIAINVLRGSTDMEGNLSSQEEKKSASPAEPEVTSEGVTSDLPAVSASEDLQISVESDPPPAEEPSSETPQPEEEEEEEEEANHTDSEVPQEEKQLVILLEKEEEELIGPTITLLEKEDKSDEKKRDAQERHPVDPNCCSPAPSLWEYVQRRCSATSRKCQTGAGEPESAPIHPSVRPLAPSSGPEPHNIEDEETSQLPETVEKPESEQLDPSLTLNLPAVVLSESSCAKPTTAVETPPFSTEEPMRESERSQDASVEVAEMADSSSSSVHVVPSITSSVDVSVTPTEPNAEATQTEISTQDPSSVLPTPHPSQPEHQAEPSLVPEGFPGPAEGSGPASEPVIEAETSGSQEANVEEVSASSSGNGHLSHSASDIYAEPFNSTEHNGNPVHGSSQKESVFMRLNNRIKALEVNMSLSGRYLEQLSQRYRKQMEEMQRAFNKTIIKLQNTSRIAEEQDLRQTESIQLLHSQLENVTQLVLNLSVRVSQLHDEVSDRQTYLLLSLMLCLCLGLLLCVNHCRFAGSPPTDPEPPAPKSYTHCCPERSLSSCEEAGLKKSASYPLIHTDSLQLATSADPEVLHAEQTNSLCPTNRKRRRRKSKLLDKVDALQVSRKSAPELSNGAVACNGAPASKNPTVLTKQLLLPSFRDSPSEGSSEGSSHSDEPSFCGIAACSRVCDGLPPPKTRAEKRAMRRRPPKPRCAVLGLPHDSQRDGREALPVTIQDLYRRKSELRSGAVATLTGSV